MSAAASLSQHVRLVTQCRREGHPGFEPERKTFVIGGEPHTFLICTRCGSGEDPRPVALIPPTVRYRGLTIIVDGRHMPRVAVTADSARQAERRVANATDRAMERGEPFYSYFDIVTTEVGPRRWECKLLCGRDAINVRGEWLGLDGVPVAVGR